MPRDKDFKKKVRTRMEKTGESYTTARAQLLAKTPAPAGGSRTDTPAPAGGSRTDTPAAPADADTTVGSTAKSAPPSPATFAQLAGMSDDAVEAKTGHTWPGWVEILDAAGCADRPHPEIVAEVGGHGVSDWWSQTVTVGYERIKGLREIGQRRSDGSYEATKSKTYPVPLARLYAAFDDPELRRRWLPGVDLTVRTATAEKSARVTWPDETRVEIYFTGKGDAKSQISVQHCKLPDKEEIAARKAYWAERLKALGEVLAGSG